MMKTIIELNDDADINFDGIKECIQKQYPTVSVEKYSIPIESDLNKFGVKLKPKVKYRFKVQMINFGIEKELNLTNEIISIGKPSVTRRDNNGQYSAGIAGWEPITIVLDNWRGNDPEKKLERLVSSQIQKQLNHFDTTNFTGGNPYKFSIKVETIFGDKIEKYVLEGCFITNCNFHEELDGTDTIVIDVNFDNATFE